MLDGVADEFVDGQRQRPRCLGPQAQGRPFDRRPFALADEVEHQLVRHEKVKVSLAERIGAGVDPHQAIEAPFQVGDEVVHVAGGLGRAAHDRAHRGHRIAQRMTQVVRDAGLVQEPAQAGIVGFHGREAIHHVSRITHWPPFGILIHFRQLDCALPYYGSTAGGSIPAVK